MYSNTATLSKRRSSKLPVESVSNGVNVGRLLAHGSLIVDDFV